MYFKENENITTENVIQKIEDNLGYSFKKWPGQDDRRIIKEILDEWMNKINTNLKG